MGQFFEPITSSTHHIITIITIIHLHHLSISN